MAQRQHTMWITLFIVTLLVWFSETQAGSELFTMFVGYVCLLCDYVCAYDMYTTFNC